MPETALIGIVDDDAEFLAALSSLVRSLGCRVESFGSGKSLIDRAKLVDFACVISDINMPEIGGIELTTILSRTAADLPIILMSGRSAPEIEVRAYSCGARGFFTKPFGFDKLAENLRQLGALPE